MDSRVSKSIILFGLAIIGIILYSAQVNAEGCCIVKSAKTCTNITLDYPPIPYNASTCNTTNALIWLGDVSCTGQTECALQCCCKNDGTPPDPTPLIKNSTTCGPGFTMTPAGTDQTCNQACGITSTEYTLRGFVNSTVDAALDGVTIYVNGIHQTQTAQSGNYSFFDIGVGPYSVTAFKDGCGIQKKDVTISGNGQIAWANFTLNCTRCTSSPSNPCSDSTGTKVVSFTCPDHTFIQNIFCGQTTSSATCNNGTFEKGEWCEKINGQEVNLCAPPYTCDVNDCTKCTLPTASPQDVAATCRNGAPDPNEQCDFNETNPARNFSTCKIKTMDACNLDTCQCEPQQTICEWNITYTAAGWNAGCCAATTYAGLEPCVTINPPNETCIAAGGSASQRPSVADIQTQYANPACVPNNAPAPCGNGKIEGNEQCDFNMSRNPPFQEIIDDNSCANTTVDGCIVNTCRCKLNTYLCEWTFDGWTECTGQQFQRALYNDSSDPQCTKPGAYYATARPEITRLCPSFSPACGNGLRNESEECDFNVTTGRNFSDCINPTNISTCNTEICKCFALPPPELANCSKNPGNITMTAVGVKYREKNITMNWTVNESCNASIDYFKIFRCDNTSGDCTLDKFTIVPKGASINKTNRSFNDDEISMGKTYCYFVQVDLNSSVRANETPKNSSIRCMYSGDEECLTNPSLKSSNTTARICGMNMPQRTEWCDQNNTHKNKSCETAPDAEFCTRDPSSGNAICKPVNKFCDACNGLYAFSMFGTQGFRLYNQTSQNNPAMQCPTTLGEYAINSCYRDYSMTVVDKVYSCGDITDCYSYHSQTDCVRDPCQRFTVGKNPLLTNLCEWKPYVAFTNSPTTLTNIFSKGVCRPQNASMQDCSACPNPATNFIGPCTPEICALYGECYGGACTNADEITCNDYNNSDDCIGKSPNAQAVDVDAHWNSAGYLSGDTNKLNHQSNDTLTFRGYTQNLGRCKWISTGCIKDADNDGIKDCENTDDLSCNLDNKPPITIIQNKPKYGKIMDLAGLSVIDDSGGTLMQCASPLQTCLAQNNGLYLLYNISAGTSGGYPNKFIDPYNPAIDLEAMFSNLSESQIYTFSYFAVDAAHNLEQVKNFTFSIDTHSPNMSINITQRAFKPSSNQAWRTNLTVNLTLVADASLPVICEVKLHRAPSGWEGFDISNGQFPTNHTSITATYPSLPDEEYELETTCRDDVGNTFNNITTIIIDADTRISNVTPRWKTFTNATKPYSMNITTDTSAIECRYSEKEDRYSDMNAAHKFISTSGTNTSWYVQLDPVVNDSRIYHFFVACNFTQGIVEQISGDDIIFAIDDVAPETILIDETTKKLYLSDFSNSQSLIKLRFNVTNDYWKLNSTIKNMNFAFNSTWWCLEGSMKNTDRCNNPQNNYTNYAYSTSGVGGIITLDYNVTTPGNWNAITGSDPQICYYSLDQGNNTETVQCIGLSVKNPLFLGPTITIISSTE